MTIVVNGKVFELHITRNFCISVVAEREIAAIDMRTAKIVAITDGGIEIGIKNLRPYFRAHLVIRMRSCFRERTSKPFNGLKAFV